MRVQQRSPTRSRSRPRAVDEDKDEQPERSRSTDRESRRNDRGQSPTPLLEDDRKDRKQRSARYDVREQDYDDRYRDEKGSRGDRTRTASADSKYRSSRRDKEKHRSSRSHRDRSKDRRRHRSRSPREYEDDEVHANGEKDSDGSSRRKHRSGEKDKYADRSRDKERERDRKDRKDRDRYDDYDRSRDKDKDRKHRKDREVKDDDRDYDRSSRRSRKDRERERDSKYDERERDTKHDDRDRKEKPVVEEDVVGQMMKKRAVSPPLNAPTGPSANGFSIKGRSKNVAMPPPPTGPRGFQPPKGPAADRRSGSERRKSSVSSVPSEKEKEKEKEKETQDHYAAERERNARERDSREWVDKPSSSASKSLHSRISSSSRPSPSSKRPRDEFDDSERGDVPKGPKADAKPPTGPASHREKRRKSGTTGDDNIANLFTAGLRKNAKARRGGVRTEGDVEREMEQRERERR
jgi:hypothetical protein